MKVNYIHIIAVICLAFCSCISPINMTQDRAKTLGNNRLEVAGSYTQYSQTDDNSNEMTNSNYGGRIGIGLSDNVDLKARYERLVSAEDNGGEGNYLSLLPKINLFNQKISLLVPVSSYFENVIFDDESHYSIAPEIIGTYSFGTNADASVMIKGDYFFSTENDSEKFYWGFKIGFGLSSNLDKWAIRPEAGYMYNPGAPEQIWSYGLGLMYIFDLTGK